MELLRAISPRFVASNWVARLPVMHTTTLLTPNTIKKHMLFNFFTKKNGNWKDDTLSGLTVALALVP
ncbi:MAG: hypothetical protein OEU86_01930, partial [Gammaproteobacteria bacterium]|nr:hypothetical protein [Gammaproteobacteria bacterium]